jgi:membrane fusion protein (multidrug efflux system)
VWNGTIHQKSWFPKVVIILVLMLCCILITTGCQKKEKKVVRERVANVRVTEVITQSIRPAIESVGTLFASEEVVVSSEIDGILKVVHVDEGNPISKRSVLAEVNDTDYRLDAERAEAVLRQAKATLQNIKQEYQRKEALYKEELVTKQQFDDVSTRLINTEGELDRARITLTLSKERLGKTKIHSPINGIVKEKKVTAGNYLRNGTPILSIVQIDPLKLKFTVTEKDVGRLKIGQDVLFKVDAFPGKEFKGKLHTIYPHIEERTRTMQVEALIANAQRQLRPGFFARIVLYTGPPKDTIVIPVNAVMYDNLATKAFTVEGDKAKEKPIKIGYKYGEYVEVIDGLKTGEQLVIVGQNSLAGGMKVNVAR